MNDTLTQDVTLTGGTYRVTTEIEQLAQADPEVRPLVLDLPTEHPIPAGTQDLTLVQRHISTDASTTTTAKPVVNDLWNVSDLMALSGRSGRVETAGWGSASDGCGMTWEIIDTLPEGATARTSVPTSDDRWAVPQGLPFTPPEPVHSSALASMLRRARTFQEEGGTDLVWDATRRGPGLSDTPVHSTLDKPYPITCSHFVGMVLAGWEYRSTTYTQDVNFRTGWYSPLGVEPTKASIWQAHLCAKHFWRQGRLWLTETEADLRAGDILFFSKHDPEDTWVRVLARQMQPYFGNIYHTAIYLGGGRILQSTGPSSPTGVWEADLSSLSPTLTWAARPAWAPPEYVTLSVVVDGLESPVSTTTTTP